jgi:hypothetical protein
MANRGPGSPQSGFNIRGRLDLAHHRGDISLRNDTSTPDFADQITGTALAENMRGRTTAGPRPPVLIQQVHLVLENLFHPHLQTTTLLSNSHISSPTVFFTSQLHLEFKMEKSQDQIDMKEDINTPTTMYIDPIEERKVIKKLDRVIMPLMAIVYFFQCMYHNRQMIISPIFLY